MYVIINLILAIILMPLLLPRKENIILKAIYIMCCMFLTPLFGYLFYVWFINKKIKSYDDEDTGSAIPPFNKKQ